MKRLLWIILLCLLIVINLSRTSAHPVAKVTSLEKALSNTQQPPIFYSIQLYASHSTQSARRFATALPQHQTLAIIRVRPSGKTYYKVIAGRFTSYQQAHHYLDSSGRKLQRYHPWIAKITPDVVVVPLHQRPLSATIYTLLNLNGTLYAGSSDGIWATR